MAYRQPQLDIKYGSTQAGPHRADLGENRPQKSDGKLIRGQKTASCALKVAKVSCCPPLSGDAVCLVDDLPAKLDEPAAGNEALANLGSQLFVTSVEAKRLSEHSTTQIPLVSRGTWYNYNLAGRRINRIEFMAAQVPAETQVMFTERSHE